MGRHGTIAGRKNAQDARRAAMFTKYARQIIVAAKAGGDPDYNPALRVAIDKAKGIGMPNDNIKRAVQKGTGELGGESYEELRFEGYGAGGVAIIVDALTDNTNRTTAAVRSSFDKFGGNLGTPGCVSYMFSKKGVIVLDSEGLDEDEVMEAVLEAGADDLQVEEDSFVIYTDPDAFPDVHKACMDAGYEIVEADVENLPSMESNPTDPAIIKQLKKLVSILEDNDDVQKVATNCGIDLYEED